MWGGTIKRLEDLGSREDYGKCEIAYVIKSSRAVDLIKQMLGDLSIKALVKGFS
ncbi:hypothetical protein [Vulcanisaeta sp. JCM 16159]|uniref:hypothetical protein n=1 Tax=Vulcanisaeta sp. JCM 16159 TaxID=1295371 RepID=UPI000B0FA114|nr:hypothetical protein [Vulcanisaeta sp. JCM 16159]